MKFLYGTEFFLRYEAIAALVPANSQVLEVCAGDAFLYSNYLKQKNVRYTGMDLNPAFVRAARKKNISFQKCDLITDEIPASDYVLIHASLYQFIPDEQLVVKKLLAAAKHTLIIAEPIKNLSDSENPLISFIAKYAANPGKNHTPKRFNAKTLGAFFNSFPEFKELHYVEGNKEMIGVFRK